MKDHFLQFSSSQNTSDFFTKQNLIIQEDLSFTLQLPSCSQAYSYPMVLEILFRQEIHIFTLLHVKVVSSIEILQSELSRRYCES